MLVGTKRNRCLVAGRWEGIAGQRPPSAGAVQFVHFKCTQRQGEEVADSTAAALTELTCPSHRCRGRLTFIGSRGQTRRNFRCMQFPVAYVHLASPLHCLPVSTASFKFPTLVECQFQFNFNLHFRVSCECTLIAF